MLAPSLYRALVQRFGQVRIVSEGQPRKASTRNGKETVHEYGESFNVCCPFCGDTKYRLSVGYTWLSRDHTGKRAIGRINCYNEGCRDVYQDKFWQPFADAIDRGATMDRMASLLAAPPPAPPPIRLPKGCRPLSELPADHPAFAFLARQYPRVPRDVFLEGGVQFTDQYDETWRLAANRLIFPILQGGELLSWQGRTINPLEDRCRWLLPGGFPKAVYRHDEVPGDRVVVITEGIPACLGTHRDAVAVFGCRITARQVEAISKRWRRAIIATDPDTFVPDHRIRGEPKIAVEELLEKLTPVMECCVAVQWPQDLLDQAALRIGPRHKEPDMKALPKPDAADLGRAFMEPLIEHARNRLYG